MLRNADILSLARDQAERSTIIEYVQRYEGVIEHAAEALGVPVRTLQWKIARYQLHQIVREAREARQAREERERLDRIALGQGGVVQHKVT